MAVRKENGEKRPPWSTRFTLVSYLCTLAFAGFLLWMVLPGTLYQSGGLEKIPLPYLVLELPVDSAGAGDSPLAASLQGEEPAPPHDAIMKKKRMTPEEYLRWLKRWTWKGEHLIRRHKGEEYEIYSIPAAPGTTRIPLPVGYEYRLSGNGEDGFVVTAWKKKEPGLVEAFFTN